MTTVRGIALVAVMFGVLAAGCTRERSTPTAAGAAKTEVQSASSAAPTGAAPALVAASAAARPSRVAGPAAFDLALAEGGALLAWSPPRAQGGGLFVQRLDRRGVPREAALRLAQTDAGGEVIELAATGLGARVGVAWLESSAAESHTRALLVHPGEPSPPEPARLLLGEGGRAPGRSRLAVGGGRAGRLRVLHATSAQDCGRGNSEPCTGYTFSELGDEGARPPRPPRSAAGGEWLRVPSPCPGVPPLLGGAGSALYYAVCTDADGTRATTAYGVDVQSEYAHAVQVLAGCTPTALLAPLRDGAWVVGQCDDGLRAAELGTDASHGTREHALAGLEAVCIDRVITLRAGELQLPLVTPLDGLEALLPEALAPAGSVAVFTGEALLVVREQGGELVLGQHACEDGRLAESR